VGFLKSRIFTITVLVQVAGPLLFTFGNWANVIQYVSGFGIAYALWEYFTVHKPEIQRLRDHVTHLHARHDAMSKQHDRLIDCMERFVKVDKPRP